MWPLSAAAKTNTQTHLHTRSTLPPAAPELLMDAWVCCCCCCSLIFQLLCLSLSSTLSVSIFLGRHKMHTSHPAKRFIFYLYWNPHPPHPSPTQGNIFSFIRGPLPAPCLKRWAGGNKTEQNGKRYLYFPPTPQKGRRRRIEKWQEALIATHAYNHILLLEYCSYLMPFVISVDEH